MDHNDVFIIYMTVLVALIFFVIDISIKHEQFVEHTISELYSNGSADGDGNSTSLAYRSYQYMGNILRTREPPPQSITDYFVKRYAEDFANLNWVIYFLVRVIATLDLIFLLLICGICPALGMQWKIYIEKWNYVINIVFTFKRNDPVPLRDGGLNRELAEFNSAVDRRYRFASGDYDVHSWLDFLQHALIRFS